MVESVINLDSNASYGLIPAVKQALSGIGDALNPSSIHTGGQKSKAIIERAREEVVALLELSKKDRVVFTSGATEANNAAISSPFVDSLTRLSELKPNVVITAIEHASVIEPCRRLGRYGCELRVIEPKTGEFTPDSIVSACDENTKLVSVMLANNETGAILPVKQIVSAIKARFPKILFHTDAVQAVGKIPLSFTELGLDLLTLSAHKIGGLAGVGALIIKAGVQLPEFILGGPQENRLRAGTENLIGIVSLGAACSYMRSNLSTRIAKMTQDRAKLLLELRRACPNLELNSPMICLPNTLNIRFPGINADDLVVALDQERILISAGAACSSGKPESSHVLMAIGLSDTQAKQTVRLSLTAELSSDELEYVIKTLIKCLKRFG